MSKVGLSAIRQDPLALVGFDPVKQLSMRRKPILVTFLHSVAMFTWLHYQRAQTMVLPPKEVYYICTTFKE